MVKHLWDRKEGERSAAYHYFCLYRDLGEERSINKLRRALIDAKAEILPTKTRLQTISARNDWVKRCEAYDDYILEKIRIEKEKERIEMYERHAQYARDYLIETAKKRIQKEIDEGIDITATEARHRMIQGLEAEAKALGVKAEKEEVDVTGKINIVFTDDLKDA